VCCVVLQRVAVCVTACVAVCCRVYYSVEQCVAVCFAVCYSSRTSLSGRILHIRKIHPLYDVFEISEKGWHFYESLNLYFLGEFFET